MSYEPKTTTDHDTIRQWVQERDGQPARISGSSDEDDQAGTIRIDFGSNNFDYPPDYTLEPISWSDFFNKFEDENLMLLYQNETEQGDTSRFNKLVKRK